MLSPTSTLYYITLLLLRWHYCSAADPGDDEDASIADDTSSRFLNYYIEGQKWLYPPTMGSS